MSESLWAGHVEKTAAVQLALSMLSSLSSIDANYNFPIAIWGLFCAHNPTGRGMAAYLLLLLSSLVMDIIFCAIWGPSIHDVQSLGTATTNAENAGLAFLIINMFAKLPATFAAYRLFIEMGGTSSLQQATLDDYHHADESTVGGSSAYQGGASKMPSTTSL